MSLYAIADTHLSLGTDKPMDVFQGWSDYVDRLKSNWERLVSGDDTVVIGGDISWAMKLEECYEDFSFLHSLPGKKILLKGNHDYWWQTKKKIEDYLSENRFTSIRILFNNAYEVGDIAVCGSRGWYYDKETEQDLKVINREVGRIRTSISAAKATGKRPVLFLHYPPVYGDLECEQIMNVILGIMAKVAPQMNMFSVGMQLKVLSGYAVLFLSVRILPAMAEMIFKEIRRMTVAIVQALY